ncbi:SpaH/EbpB family LPXTG-anchored major pilin [Bifidobacterium merycicum]|uniref:LPXTG-motif cell wall anchor domain protein n=1 Tax=Bifidobacterium merycicum TaxID=78345 RepID=A0A087BDB1_9BIFI|nr:SpaH/EbpB family LPXTG-anchored major pilin [Bifidobacterium merycicum]KFI69011.1 LPXTG-motif cell wall anchor domain protein [Bifidobacterium merycicum]SHE65085.1 LPXTG-motif cell wall anchor domain-containing protein/fimbrial isopeptide formation D2 domain-containing protein [Bifidobacterium merycicum DSM 6492]
MNKVLKGLVAVTASAAMAVAGFAGVASSAMAADNTVTVTVPTTANLQNHTYTAYQILTGSQAESGGALGSTSWGTGINSTNFLTALKADNTIRSYFTNVNTSDEFVKALGNADNFASNGANTNIVAKIALANKTGDGTALRNGANTLATGYYLIVDSTTGGNQTVYNPAVLAITSNITIQDKTSVPTLEKKVQENKKSVTGEYGNGFNDVADYNIGDDVPFHLIGSVPDMSQYETYKYMFSDTLDDGFDAPTSVKVYLSDNKALDTEEDADITSSFTITNPLAKTFTVSTNNLKAIAGVATGKYVIVSYTAKLNSSAQIGLPGNVNTAKLTYSNKPDQSGQGENQPTGETPEDKVIVFTYKLDTTKVDSDKDTTKLPGAEFKLKNANNQYAVVDEDNKVTSWVDAEADGSTLTSDDNGLFSVTGLDNDTYYLKETKAPAGYNLPARDFEVKISADTANGQNWDGTKATAATDALRKIDVTVDGTAGTGDVQTGTAAIVIKNTKGSSLPSTGGMGTTILYAAGAAIVLVAAFGIAFAVRRRNAR